MAKKYGVGGLTVDSSGNFTFKNKTDAQLKKQASNYITPLYANLQAQANMGQAANQAAVNTAQAGTDNAYASGGAAIDQAAATEAAKASADAASRGVSLDAGNSANLTGTAVTQAKSDMAAAKEQARAGLDRQANAVYQQYQAEMKNMDYAKARDLYSQYLTLKQQGQNLFTVTNQTKYAKAHSGGGGGGRRSSSSSGSLYESLLKAGVPMVLIPKNASGLERSTGRTVEDEKGNIWAY